MSSVVKRRLARGATADLQRDTRILLWLLGDDGSPDRAVGGGGAPDRPVVRDSGTVVFLQPDEVSLCGPRDPGRDKRPTRRVPVPLPQPLDDRLTDGSRLSASRRRDEELRRAIARLE